VRRNRSAARLFLDQAWQAFPDLSKEEQVALAAKRDGGCQEAKNLLVLQALPYAFKRASALKFEVEDAIELACDCAMHCAEKYSPSKGCLSTLVHKDVFQSNLRRGRESMQTQFEGSHRHFIDCYRRPDGDNGHARESDTDALRRRFNRMCGRLPPREKLIMKMMADGKCLREIGAVLRLSNERVRVIGERAKDMLREMVRRNPVQLIEAGGMKKTNELVLTRQTAGSTFT
jgi:RNA polymerase sigma factor (sigma-70 family)